MSVGAMMDWLSCFKKGKCFSPLVHSWRFNILWNLSYGGSARPLIVSFSSSNYVTGKQEHYQQAQDVESMLVLLWSTVYDIGPNRAQYKPTLLQRIVSAGNCKLANVFVVKVLLSNEQIRLVWFIPDEIPDTVENGVLSRSYDSLFTAS